LRRENFAFIRNQIANQERPMAIVILDHFTFEQRIVKQFVVEPKFAQNHAGIIVILLDFFIDKDALVHKIDFGQI